MTTPSDKEDLELTSPPQPWSHDGEGYPLAAGLDAIDPDRLPESEGMAEDPIEETATVPALPAPKTEEAEPLRLGLEGMGSHLEELRKRIVVCLAVFIPFFAAGLYFYRTLWEIVIRPLRQASPDTQMIQALSPSDGLIMAMRMAFALAVFLSLPVWLSQFWSFVSPGLTSTEKRWLYLCLGSGGVLFIIGACAAYFLGVPFALEFLLPFNQSMSGWENSFTGAGYVDFVITCCAGFGFAFELPLVMLALALAGILTPDLLREWWRVIILVIFIVAAILTPPDPFTQMLLALPMLVLFFVGYWLVKWAQPEK